MSTLSGSSPRNLPQQRKLAKDLLKAARAGDSDAISRLQKVHPAVKDFKLAHTQLAIAREASFDSWPKLVKHLEHSELQEFKTALTAGDATTLRRLLTASPRLRKKINSPIFDFGRRPIIAAVKHLPAVDVLLEFGADINLRSDWQNGPFGVFDDCLPESAHDLLAHGAKLTPHAAARFGWLQELRRMVAANPEVVHEKGGDGQRPLHFAKTPEIADFLLEHGAQIDAKCVDHDCTAAQYALKERPEVTAHLLIRGAAPDIFMAARIGDLSLAERLINQDPTCLALRTSVAVGDRVPGIYNWVLGFYLSPHDIALNFGQQEMHDFLFRKSPPKVQLLDAAIRNDAPAAHALIRQNPSLMSTLTPEDHALLAYAPWNNRIEGFKLMLNLGFDPMARGMDGGTVLHQAAWTGNPEMIQELLTRGADIHALDPTHKGTPLGWAIYGSIHRRQKGADYAAAIEVLVRNGADIKAPYLIGMATENPPIQQVLRRLGAT